MPKFTSFFWRTTARLGVLCFLISCVVPAWCAPLVSITRPAEGEIVNGRIQIDVTYRSDSKSPIKTLLLLIDNKVQGETRLATPKMQGSAPLAYDFSLITAATHTISVKAIDASGAAGVATIHVAVRSAGGPDRAAPVVTIYYPAPGARVSGSIEIKADARDNLGVKHIYFYLDGKLKTLKINTTPPYTDRWDTTRLPDGPHLIQAAAVDAAENEGRSAEVMVIVQNHLMTTMPPEAQAATPVAPTPSPAPVTVAPLPVEETAPFLQEAPPPMMMPSTGGAPRQIVAGSPSGSGLQSEAPQVAALPPVVEVAPRVSLGTSPLASALSAAAPVLPAMQLPTPVVRPSITVAGLTLATPTLAPLPEPVVSSSTGLTLEPRTIGLPSIAPQGLSGLMMAARTGTPTELWGSPLTPAATPAQALTSEARLAATAMPGSWEQDALLAMRTDTPTGEPRGTRPPAAATPAAPTGGATLLAALPPMPAPAGKSSALRVTKPAGKMLVPTAIAAAQGIKVRFGDKLLTLRATPEVRAGIPTAALREIFESADGTLYWYPVDKQVRAVSHKTEINLHIGDPVAQVNGQPQTLGLAPYIKCGRTMVPLEFLASALDVTITYNPTTEEIVISSNNM